MVGSRRITSRSFNRIRQIFCSAIIGVGTLIIFIVNNGNISTDGRIYRKRPKIEM